MCPLALLWTAHPEEAVLSEGSQETYAEMEPRPLADSQQHMGAALKRTPREAEDEGRTVSWKGWDSLEQSQLEWA